MKRLVSVIAALVAAGPLLAQTGRITGTVTAASDARPIAGAQVVIVGTSIGAITRDDGGYTITVQPGTYALRATRIGFAPDTVTGVVVTADAAATVNFQLAVATLQEVVVIGYGEQEARDLTGSVAQVSAEEFNTGRIVSPQELIRAKVPGVQVIDNNEPGGGISLRIRGGTSVSASNEPLYVVDGVPLEIGGGTSAGRNPLNFINPNDIESITVLKDASSTAIYGSRGANGVVVITTKSGMTGPQFSYTGTISGSRPIGGPAMASAQEFRQAVQQHAAANVAALGSANTDWLGAIQQDAGGTEHNLAVSGRRDDLTYRLSLGYLDQEGVLQGTHTQRVSMSLNYNDLVLNDRLNVRAHLKGSRARDRFTPGSVLGNAVAFAPTQPITTATGQFFEWAETRAPNNPIAELRLIDDAGTTLRSVGNIEGEYRLPFIEGLSATLRGGYDVVRADRTTFVPSTLQQQIETGGEPGNITRNSPGQFKTVFDAYATYERALDWLSSNVDLTAGFSAERFRGEYPSLFAAGLSTDLLGPSGIPQGSIRADPFLTIEESRLASGFGRVNLRLLDRYLITGTVRRDGSSRFAEGQQYGTFPSVAFAWRMSQEPFLSGRGPFSDLKLRLSWGKNGNQEVGNYLAFTAYSVGQSTAQAQLGNTFVTTIRPSGSDPTLRWEQTTSTNAGLDWGILDSRITGSIDWYTKTTDDLLFTVPAAAGTALSNFVTTNIGSVRNRGLELAVDTRLFDGGRRGFTWDANLNASTNKNELITIERPGISRFRVGGISGAVGHTIQVLQPGVPINSFFVYKHKIRNGRPVFEDLDGNGTIDDQDLYEDLSGPNGTPDGIINEHDLRAFKSPAPTWILGHTSNMTWRGFDAGFTIRAYFGNYVYNNVASNLGHFGVLTLPNGPVNIHTSALRTGFTQPQYLSDIYVEDASFIRMDNLMVGYTFERLANLDRPRVFGTIQNVFTNTDYSGVDPTAGVNGIDNNIYPRSRTFLAGLTVGF